MKSRHHLLAVLICLGAALLSGCAPRMLAPDEEAVQRSAAAHFEVEGRIAASDGNQAANGRMHWEHAPARDVWTLFSPLGQIVARMERTAEGAHLRTADGQLVEAADADTLMPRLLGVPAPLAALPRWLQAATPEPPGRVLGVDAHGRPARISDHGWIIDYPEYADDQPQALPRRIDARWGEARLRIVIDTWTFPE